MAGWGDLLGVAADLYTGYSSYREAERQSDLAMAEYNRNLSNDRLSASNQAFLMEQGRQAQALEREILNYMMSTDRQNQGLALDQMQFERDWLQQNRDFLLDEREFERYRITEADRLAARERERELQKLSEDENISSAERERALQELEYVRQVASGERDYDVNRFEEDRERSATEYQYRVREYEDMLKQLNAERDYGIQINDDILNEANALSAELDLARQGMGSLEQVKRYSDQDVLDTEAQFFKEYSTDADRAAEKLASVNEANLIRAGVDASTTGDVSRMELLQEQLVPLYDQARAKARQDALQHITGLQDNAINVHRADLDYRDNSLNEVERALGTRMGALQNLRDPSTATSGAFANLGTGVGPARQLVSAGDFRSPIGVGSQIIDRNVGSVGMSNALGTSSSAAGGGTPQSDGTFTPNTRAPGTSGSLFSSAQSGYRPTDNFRFLAESSSGTAADAMQILSQGGRNASVLLSDWLNRN